MSAKIESVLDGYTLKARYLPACIVVLPAWLSFALWFPPDKIFYVIFASAGVTLVLAILLAQIGRDAGRNCQPSLFKEWGGSPTTRALSYRYSILNNVTLTRCHVALNRILPELNLPNERDGRKDRLESRQEQIRECCRLFARSDAGQVKISDPLCGERQLRVPAQPLGHENRRH